MCKHPFWDNSAQLNKTLRKAGQIYEADKMADKLVILIKGTIENNAEKYWEMLKKYLQLLGGGGLRGDDTRSINSISKLKCIQQISKSLLLLLPIH